MDVRKHLLLNQHTITPRILDSPYRSISHAYYIVSYLTVQKEKNVIVVYANPFFRRIVAEANIH